MTVVTDRNLPDLAYEEIAYLELCEQSLAEYGQCIYDWWHPAAMHELISSELEELYKYIASGGKEGTQALILEVGPQHGKTTLASQLFPSWVLGKSPNTNIMLATYSADFSKKHSGKVRDIINGKKFKRIFGEKSKYAITPVEMSKDSFAKGEWELAEPYRGGMLAVGVDGGSTGHSAQLIIIDDPIKNRKQANSPKERLKVLEWYTSSILSREMDNTAILIIHTRWHSEDLIGECIKIASKDEKAIQFKVVSIPDVPLELEKYATNEEEQLNAAQQGLYRPMRDPLGRIPGSFESSWPEKFPKELLIRKKATLEAAGRIADWYSLHLQQPEPDDGIFFGNTMFQRIHRAPEGLKWYGYMDLAMGESERADWNACCRVAFDEESNFYIRDMIRIHDIDSFFDTMVDVMRDKNEIGTVWGVESVNFQKQIYKDFMKNKRLRKIAIEPIEGIDKDKTTRARPVRSRGLAKKMFIVDGPWVQEFLYEAFKFPTGTHDDQVDSVSGGLAMAEDGAILGDGPLVM
jgi:predicted phage terminase large subunit-like protein